jgi:hypothetical protein
MDMTEFNAAVAQYANATKKTLATATNRQFVNLTIHAVKDAKKAQAAEIRAVTKKDFWPKMVARHISRKFGKRFGKKAGQVAWLKQHGGMRGMNRYEKQWYRKLYEKYSRQFLAQRLGAIRYITVFFNIMSNKAEQITGLRAPKMHGFTAISRFKSYFLPAIDGKTTKAESRIEYPYKYRKDRAVRTADAELDSALQKAIPATIRDISEYVFKQLDKQAKINSAKGAA